MTTRRSLSWIEPQALAAALERAGVGPQPPAPPRRRPAVPRAAPAPAPAQAPPAAALFVVPAGHLGERLEAFCAWLFHCTSCRGIFIADQDGLPLLQKEAGDEMAAASPLIIRFLDLVHSRHPFVSDTGVSLELETGGRIYVLQDQSAAGKVCLGFVATAPVAGETLAHIRQTFGRALAGVPETSEER